MTMLTAVTLGWVLLGAAVMTLAFLVVRHNR